MTLLDLNLPHQIQLVVSEGIVCVTCNCHRLGKTNKFSRMQPLEEAAIGSAWRWYNRPHFHTDPEGFEPNERMLERYGI